MENLNELETMRSQMGALKRQLEHQVIINDRILRRAVSGNTSWIRSRYIVSIVVALLMVPYSLIGFRHIGFSLTFAVATCLFMLTAAGYTYYNMKALNRDFLMEADLVEAGQRIARARKMDADWLKFGIPTVILWLVWFFLEGYGLSGFAPAGLIGGVIGGAIGGICGYMTHVKIQRKYREIISQIDDLTAA